MNSIITAIIFHSRVFLVIFSLPTQFIRKTTRGLHCDRLTVGTEILSKQAQVFEPETLVFSPLKTQLIYQITVVYIIGAGRIVRRLKSSAT